MLINNDGSFTVMLHDNSTSKPKYLKGIIGKSNQQLIATNLSAAAIKTDYTRGLDHGFIFDGFTYCFDIKKDNNENKLIQFIPHSIPTPTRLLSSLLDTLKYNSSRLSDDTMDLRNYAQQLRLLYLTLSPPPPKPPKSIIKFKPVDLKLKD